MVLNTKATGGPSPAVAEGAGPSSVMKSREAVDADELGRAAAEHGEDGRGCDAVGQRMGELRRGDGLVGEIALHEIVVADDDAFDERVVDRVLLHLHLGRDRPGGGRAVHVVHRGVVEELHHAVELGLVADRQLERRDPCAKFRLQLIERAIERRPLAVELVHEDGPGESQLLRRSPGDLRLHLDALDCRDHEHREVAGAEGRDHVADEIGVSRGVEHVDLAALVLERSEREGHGDLAAGLFGIEVGGGRAVLDPAEPGDGSGVEQERLGEGGLARPAVADQGHVANLLRRERLERHGTPR